MHAPLFVTWFQCVVAVVFCFVAGHFRDAHPSLNMFPKFDYNADVAKQVLPLSVIFVGMIAFNNLCLKFVGVAFYNVGRSLTTVFNVVRSEKKEEEEDEEERKKKEKRKKEERKKERRKKKKKKERKKGRKKKKEKKKERKKKSQEKSNKCSEK